MDVAYFEGFVLGIIQKEVISLLDTHITIPFKTDKYIEITRDLSCACLKNGEV